MNEEHQVVEKVDKTMQEIETMKIEQKLSSEKTFIQKIMHPIILLLTGIVVLTLTMCSPKTRQWEEEVPLNTGETIWVTRTITYSIKGAGGNPMDMAFRPDWKEKIEFTWNNKKYVYEGEAHLMLLAISPNNQPVLVAPAGNKGWDWQHNYYCTTPHYVQFVPDANGENWTWPPAIEPWLFNMPRNLMSHRGKHNEMLSRYTAKQREKEDAGTYAHFSAGSIIDPFYTSEHCIKRK